MGYCGILLTKTYLCINNPVNRNMRKLTLSIISFLALIIPFGGKAQINTDQVIQIGRNALYFEDYVLSIQYFNQVIAAKPYLAQPYFYRALAKFNLDDLQGAEQDATTAIEHNPFIVDAYEIRGVARQNLGKAQEAIADYDQALSMLPENRGLLYNKALAQESIRDYDGAAASYATLIAAYPSWDAAYIGRAKLSLAMADTIAAIEDINRAIEMNPNAVNALIMRADISINRSQDYRQALDDMDRAIKLQPRQSGLFVNRAFLRYKLDDYFGAMSDYDYALQLEPLNNVALFNRSLLRMEVRDYNNALSDLNQVLALNPDDYRALYNRTIAHRELHDYRSALTDINRLISVFPDLAAAYFLRFDIKQRLNDRSAQHDYEKSLALAKQRIKRDGANPTASELFGSGSDKHGDESEPQEVVAARFSQLITISDNTEMEQEYNNKNIRGRVQDRNISIEPEPIFVATYYSSPTELKPTGEYLKEIDDVNSTHALNYVLQVTNHEATLTDTEEINKHFQSIEYYNSYLSTHAPRAIDYFGRGMNQMTLHNYNAAVADFKQALNIAPDFTLAQFMTAVGKYRQLVTDAAVAVPGSETIGKDASLLRARFQDVISEFEATLKLSPEMSVAYYNMGVVFIAMQDFTSALSAFNKAIECNKDFGEAYYNRGYVYFTLGNRAAGSADLSRAGQLGVAPSYNLLKRMSN